MLKWKNLCKYLPHFSHSLQIFKLPTPITQASTGNLCPVTINGCPRGKGVIASPDLPNDHGQPYPRHPNISLRLGWGIQTSPHQVFGGCWTYRDGIKRTNKNNIGKTWNNHAKISKKKRHAYRAYTYTQLYDCIRYFTKILICIQCCNTKWGVSLSSDVSSNSSYAAQSLNISYKYIISWCSMYGIYSPRCHLL